MSLDPDTGASQSVGQRPNYAPRRCEPCLFPPTSGFLSIYSTGHAMWGGPAYLTVYLQSSTIPMHLRSKSVSCRFPGGRNSDSRCAILSSVSHLTATRAVRRPGSRASHCVGCPLLKAKARDRQFSKRSLHHGSSSPTDSCHTPGRRRRRRGGSPAGRRAGDCWLPAR